MTQPIADRRRYRSLIALALCVTATVAGQAAAQSTLDDTAPAPIATPLALPATVFMTDASRLATAVVELRSEAKVYGQEIRFKQIARWSDADNALMQPLGELIVARAEDETPFRSLTVEQVQTVLCDAGINLATLRFTGATSCRVARADVRFDETEAMMAWAKPNEPMAVEAVDDLIMVAPSGTAKPQATPAGHRLNGADDLVQTSPRSLRAQLVSDLASRLSLDRANLQLTFKPTDEKVLNLAEPQFRFTLDARRVRALGTVVWDVTILTDGGQHKTTIQADAKAWQDQVIVDKPIAARQVIRADDVTTRRVLSDETPTDTLVSLSQIVGQQATRNLPAGALMTARLIQAVPLVRAGQLVSVTLGQGGIRIKTVARAAESGTFGQTIKVKNETTRDVYDVKITGPQMGVVGDLTDHDVALAQ
ncbi:MAG TPA: flagellar basal body P-ring formation chaperone FlgA [Tepidisphaeraceae bacterium]|nr:flagellar basal body P-ring formation chaperone FlgA [Tepidisphaeraceae bacterium]